tara:strand:- start:420 stop:1565 length:1146 start_codon:yes stop_codon:yes gene_type:complete
MNRKFKLKIYGECPRSLFLAFVLAKLKCDIYLYDFLRNTKSEKDYQTILFSYSSRYLLNKYNIWNEIENVAYDFTSLSVIDNYVSEQLILGTENFSIEKHNTIGWTAKYIDIKRLLLDKLINAENVHFISKNQDIDEPTIFDYEFNFKDYDKELILNKFPLLNHKKTGDQILIFNVYLRGHVEKRLYEINTNKGLLIFTPLKKDLYQIIWNNTSFGIKERSQISKSFFLDNLTTLLPNELKIDQIIGDINFLCIGKNYSNYFIKKKTIYFNENKFKSNSLYDLNFEIIIIKIIQMYKFLENNESRIIYILNRFGFYYLLNKYTAIKLNLTISNSLFNLFKYKNILSLLLRKLLFTLLKRKKLMKILFMRNLNNSNISNLVK